MPRSLLPLLLAALGMFLTQHLIVPALTPLSTEAGLSPTRLSLVITVSSAALALSSPLWGWALDSIGLRAVLIAGLALSVLGLAGFAAAVTFGLDETLNPDLSFAFVVVFRGVLVGAGLAVFAVAALAVAGTTTVAEGDRTRAVGLVWAVQGLAALIGPPIGGLLVFLSLLLPLYLAPVIALLVAVVVLIAVKPVERPRHTVPTRPWELLPAFGVGFLMYLAFALSQAVITLLVKARLEMSTNLFAISGIMLLSALGLVVTQGVVVPLLRWSAARLMRTGAPIALAGYAILAVSQSLWLAAMAFLLVAVGLGLAVTGFAAAASLGVGPRHQGLVAGLVCAAAGLAVLAGTMLSGLLYDLAPIAPVIAAGVATAVAWVLSLPQLTSRVPESVA
ncbi:MFS transporter [Lentzea kentuckyensis]|uniref:MFS transporter n=1 Tax=Lentzea kentuckyensis TaxID=360086 RepID=UPI000A3CDCD8|nr:MFS transporter [Lentzea kentuckyensis]